MLVPCWSKFTSLLLRLNFITITKPRTWLSQSFLPRDFPRVATRTNFQALTARCTYCLIAGKQGYSQKYFYREFFYPESHRYFYRGLNILYFKQTIYLHTNCAVYKVFHVCIACKANDGQRLSLKQHLQDGVNHLCTLVVRKSSMVDPLK